MSLKKYLGKLFVMFSTVIVVGMLVSGCGQKPAQEPEPYQEPQMNAEVNVPGEQTVDISTNAAKDTSSGNLVSYDVSGIGRNDPFMPYGEIQAFNKAESDAYAEANAHNARIAAIKSLQGTVIREADDISPYSFNLPVPPTSLASENSTAARITRTKVVGIMYNRTSPSAIINVDNKDYLVRTGDKIIGEEYKVLQINPTWVTVSFGSNVYSAAIGELFSKDDLNTNQNDVYNLKNRFGGRKG